MTECLGFIQNIGPIGLLIILGLLFALVAAVGVIVWAIIANQRRD